MLQLITVDNKIKQNKSQYNLNRQTARQIARFIVKKCLPIQTPNWWGYLTREMTVRKSCCNQKLWIFTIRKWVEKVN